MAPGSSDSGPNDSGPGDSGPGDSGPGDADRRADPDAAWRTIVENYGERASLDGEPPTAPPGPEPAAGSGSSADLDAGPPPVDPARLARLFEPLNRPPQPAQPTAGAEGGSDLAKGADAPFVPPPPPPVPQTTGDRRAAWVGVLGAPVVLLVCLVLTVRIGPLVLLGLVAAFVVGFVYLVVQMPRGPRDPGDDGARL